MTDKETSILGSFGPAKLVGREDELRRLSANERPLILTGEPGSGSTELLKQAYDQLFRQRTRLVPFYFSFNDSGADLAEAGKNFFHSMLLQINAFRRNEPRMLQSALTLREVIQRTGASDANVVRGLIKYFGKRRKGESDREYLVKILSAPIRANAAGIPLAIFIDDLHELDVFEGGDELIGRVVKAYSTSEVSVVLGGAAASLIAFEEGPSLRLSRLSLENTSTIVKSKAAVRNVVVTDDCADLIAAQLDRDLKLISLFIASASDVGVKLDSFETVERLYASEIIDGRISRYFSDKFGPSSSDLSFVEGIYRSMTDGSELDLTKSQRTRLAARGVIVDSIQPKPVQNTTISDHIGVRYHGDVLNEKGAVVEGRCVVASLKRAPKLLAREYRRKYAIGVRELLMSFSGETVPLELIDNTHFAERFRGVPDEEALADIARSVRSFSLPNIVFAADTSDIYEPIDQVCDPERSAVGFGFTGRAATDTSDVVWIVAEVESKLEASLDHTEFWCDRLEMAALMSGLAPYKIWLIAPEGFSHEANELLIARGAIGSSLRQVSLMRDYRERAALVQKARHVLEEVEITLPMDDRTELVAASIAEEIARRHNFAAKAINQIKTALIEAFINASEHSLSPDRKVHNKFTVDDRGLTIVISNRGVRLADKAATQSDSDEQRRGWGLDLMRRLMDEVSVEETDDGTRISMTKVLQND